ncbi:MAG TPA: ABC transporter permease subunit [Candidatus Limnocylindria bacterium]
MNTTLARILRVPLTVAAIWVVLAIATPLAMARYAFYVPRPGITCTSLSFTPAGIVSTFTCRSLADIYHRSFEDLMVDATFRSVALLLGAGVLALVLGGLIGVTAALLRRRAFAGGGILGLTSLLSAIPAFFVAYFLQIAVIVLGASETGGRLLPVFGFGYDEHLVLPLVAISLPAIAHTAQLAATRIGDVLDADFITAANAKGLRTSWILAVHVLPHVRPVVLEGLGGGLRISVASLPIVEFLFKWGGIGQLSLEAVGVHDAAGFVFGAVVLGALFAVLGAIADISRPRALFRSA